VSRRVRQSKVIPEGAFLRSSIGHLMSSFDLTGSTSIVTTETGPSFRVRQCHCSSLVDHRVTCATVVRGSKKMTMTTRKLLNAIVAATIAVMCSAAQARASAIQLNSPSDLSGGGTEVTYPSSLPNPLAFDVAAGAVTLSFSTPGLFNVFEQDGSFAPDFPLTSMLLADLQQGPLTISFSTGIRELGFFAQGLFPDVPEAFTFNVFNGASLLNTFTAGPTTTPVCPEWPCSSGRARPAAISSPD
jgi:hypothetical protein